MRTQQPSNPETQKPRNPTTQPGITLAILIFVAVARIASTYRIFSDTADEAMHLSAGLQVLSDHHFGIHIHNPPLPRVVTAFIPWLAGARWDAAHPSMEQIGTMFFVLGNYKRMLVLARVGTLIFFVIAVLCTTFLARGQIGKTGALLAAFFFTTQPTILGHAGLATVDIAGTAGFAVALCAFAIWLARPSWRNTFLVGLAYGFAVNCKFLCIPYVPIACGAVYGARLIYDETVRRTWRRSFALLTVPFVAFAVVWAGYGFSVGKYGNVVVPAPLFWSGLFDIMAVNRAGFGSYAFGQVSTSGWWWYFPAALGLKSPIAFLLLVIGSLVFARRSVLAWIAAAAGILALAMDTHVDIGVRYIMPIFVPLSIAAAAGTLAMLRGRAAVRVTAMILLTWYLVSTTVAHPDYLAYFNEIGGRDPSRYLIDSNLDWGQDLLRLRDVLRQHHVARVGVAVMGTANYDRLGYPDNYPLDPKKPSEGWVAVSDHIYRMEGSRGGYQWLDPYKYQRVGKSIRLIHIPPVNPAESPTPDSSRVR